MEKSNDAERVTTDAPTCAICDQPAPLTKPQRFSFTSNLVIHIGCYDQMQKDLAEARAAVATGAAA